MINAEDKSQSFQHYLDILKRRKLSLLLPALVTIALALMVAFGLPPAYQSQAKILIQEQEVPQDFVRTTISSFAAQQVQVISQRILTVESIGGILGKFNLYEEGNTGSSGPSTELANKFRDNVLVELVSADVIDPRSGRPSEATIAFTLSFTDADADTAQQVTNELVTLFLNENLRERTRQVTSTEEFLKTEAEGLNKELVALEQRMADFKTAHEGSLPESYQFNLTTLERTQVEFYDTQRRIRELQKRKIELAANLAQLSPSAPVVLPSGETVLSSADRLKALQSEHRGKAAIYQGTHPDVIRLEREISALQAELGIGADVQDLRRQLLEQQRRLSELQTKYSDSHQDVQSTRNVIAQLEDSIRSAGSANNRSYAPQPDNPAYILLDTQLRTTESEMRALSDTLDELQTKLRRYEGLLKQAPEVEKNYQALQREQSNVSTKYEDIKTKLREAAVSTSLEREQKGQRLTLIEPPSLPLEPASPNRPAIIFLGFLLAAAVGVGFALIRELMDRTVHGVHQLAAIMGEAPMVVIPYINNDDDILRQQHIRKLSLTIALAAGLLFVLYLHFFYRPLDVLFFAIMNKLGLG
jgi:polysaccharide biosynthesis transport protein